MKPYRNIYLPNTTKREFKKRNSEGTLEIPYYGKIYYGEEPFTTDDRDIVYRCLCDIQEIKGFKKVPKPRERGWMVIYNTPTGDTDFPVVRARLDKSEAHQLMCDAMRFGESAGYKVTGSLSDTIYLMDGFQAQWIITCKEDRG